jgi:hypothetical protein
MRDYTQFFFTTDDTPFGYTAIAMNYFFETADECDQFVAANPISPGGGLLSKTAPIWFRLDKNLFLQYVRSSGLTNLGTATNPVILNGKQMVYFESPRRFGVNSFEEKSARTLPGDTAASRSDFSGAAGLLTFVNRLPAYAELLRREGRVRDAGIVLFIYNSIIAGTLSITDGLAQLRANHL